MKRIVSCAVLMAFSCSALAQARGGSNYGWFHIDGCNREPYGVIYNYKTHKSTIDEQLEAMHKSGQRRLRIPIYHGRGLDTGTVMDSSGGSLSPKFIENLEGFLAAVKRNNFAEINVGFFPIGDTNPLYWPLVSRPYPPQ